MTCFHPLKGFDTGYVNPETGKPVLIIKSQDTEYIYKPRDLDAAMDKLQDYKHVYHDFHITKSIDVPCQKCIGCRLSYSRLWADRCTLEAKGWEYNNFITLTYDTPYLTYKDCLDLETGEILKCPTLVKKDIIKFKKDLLEHYRYYYANVDGEPVYDPPHIKKEGKKKVKVYKYETRWTNIRFYLCGEYGSENGRPHYHIIAFNLPILDRTFFFKNFQGDNVYLSETIRKIWKKGNISVGDVSWNSIAYTARYIVKKQKGKTAGLVDLCGRLVAGIEPEYTNSSRDPGIAREYYEQHKDHIYEYDQIVIAKRNKVETIRPPKYFDRLFDLDSPEAMQAIKDQRRITAENAMAQQLEKTSLTKMEYLAVKERDQIYKLKSLKRKMKEI